MFGCSVVPPVVELWGNCARHQGMSQALANAAACPLKD